MTNSEMSELFGRLAVSIQKRGQREDRLINGIPFRLFTSSEINLITESLNGKWVPEGLFFEVFGTEVLLSRDGSLSVSDTDSEILDVYSMSDPKMLQAVHVYLKWRLAALNALSL